MRSATSAIITPRTVASRAGWVRREDGRSEQARGKRPGQ